MQEEKEIQKRDTWDFFTKSGDDEIQMTIY